MSKSINRVYKYHRINEHLIQLFSLNAFYCCTFTELNDPLEGKIEINEIFLNNLFAHQGDWECQNPHYTLWNEFLHEGEKDHEAYVHLDSHKPRLHTEDLGEISDNEKVNVILSDPKLKKIFTAVLLKEYNYRVVSFSKFDGDKKGKEKEKLMWSHYSGAAKGVRLTFEFPIPIETNFGDIVPIKFEPVLYDNQPPQLVTEKELLNCFRFKYEIWDYENEYRILIRNHLSIGFQQPYLKEVTFGLNVELKDVISIVRLCILLKYGCDFLKMEYIDGQLNEVPIKQSEIDAYMVHHDETGFRIEIK